MWQDEADVLHFWMSNPMSHVSAPLTGRRVERAIFVEDCGGGGAAAADRDGTEEKLPELLI